MTTLLRVNRSPLSALGELVGLQNQFNRMFDDWDAGPSVSYPRVNVAASETEATVVAELPGLEPDKVEVAVTGDELTISGKREQEKLPEGANLFKQERAFGAFSRTIQLPFAADAQKVKASFRNGMLTVVLPRSESDKPHRISIEAA